MRHSLQFARTPNRPRRLQSGAGDGLVIVDGDCGVCSALAGWLRAHLPPNVRFVPYQSLTPEDFYAAGVTREACMQRVQYIAGGRVRSGGAASVALLCRSSLWWAPLAHLGRLPLVRTVIERAYETLAPRRALISLLFGLSACRLPND